MFLITLSLMLFSTVLLYVFLRFLSKTSFIYSLKKLWRFLEDKCYVYQFYKVPQFSQDMRENQLYRKVYTYLNSLPSIEDSDFANLFSSSKSMEINLILNEKQSIIDHFLGARVHWRIENCYQNGEKSIVLMIRKNDKRRILVPYFRHIHQVFDDFERQKKRVRLFVSVGNNCESSERWTSIPFTHPATMETIVMDSNLKDRIKSDMENFLKSRHYYHRIGRVWKRSYLLYGPSGTGKSTFIAAMAKFLRYDIYELNLHNIANNSDLNNLLLQTTNKSLLVVEDLDCYLREKPPPISSSSILNFMDGLLSSCCEERIIVFTMNSKENTDSNILRPGRIDVHIHFPACDFSGFKALANSHLGLKDHKLFPQLEEIFRSGSALSQSEICEIMASNRSSSSRALKTVIAASQADLPARVGKKLNESPAVRTMEETGEPGHNGIHAIKEVKNLYGLLRARSRRKSSIEKLDLGFNDTEHL